MAARLNVPLYITCQREGCGKVKQVRTRTKQRTQKACSNRCGCLMRAQSAEGQATLRRGGLVAGSRARTRLIAEVGHLTPLVAFRLGYLRGLQSKYRKTKQLQRKVA